MMISNSPFGFYTQRRRKQRTPRLPIVVLVVVVVGFAYLFREPLQSLLWQGLRPVMMLRNALGASEAETLRQDISALQARLADRDALYQENLDLKSLLNRAAGRSVTLAGILQRPPQTPYDSMVIDAGRNQGIIEGSFVSMGGSALVGTITEVNTDTARVTLFSAAGATHEGVLMMAEKHVPLSVEGQGGGSMRAQVPSGTGAAIGDSVLLPGVGMGLMALVSHVDARDGESFETVYFSLPADLNARFVEIWQ